MIELNLLPDIKLQYVRAGRARRRVVSIVSVGGLIAVGLVVLFGIYVYAVQPARGYFLDNSIRDNAKKLSDVKDLNGYLSVQQQLAALPELHGQKQVYSRIISYLPILNPTAPNNIRISRLVISSEDKNTLKIDAFAPSYTAATIFESTVRSARFSYGGDANVQTVPLFSAVSLTNAALGQDSNGNKVVTFTLTLTASDPVFAFDSTNASISVPNKNATGSAASVPSDLFETSTPGGSN